MAGMGMTKVQAVSEILMSVNLMRITALAGPTDSSDAGEAEFVLDRMIEEVISEGHPSASRIASITASSGIVDLTSPAPLAVKVRGVGKYRSRNFTLQGTFVYDPDLGSTTIGSGSEVFTLELFELASASSPANFENLAPDLKRLIVDRAKLRYRLIKRPDQFVDAALVRDVNRSEQMRDPIVQHRDPFPNVAGGIQFQAAGAGGQVQVPRQ